MIPELKSRISFTAMASKLQVIPSFIFFIVLVVATMVTLSKLGPDVRPALLGIDIWSAVTGTDMPAVIQASTPTCNLYQQNGSNSTPQGPEVGLLTVSAVGQALHPFVLVSASRASLTTFHVLGLTAKVIRGFDKGMIYECLWQPGNSSQHAQPSRKQLVTRAELSFGNTEAFKAPYMMVILTCRYEEAIGSDGLGGLLYVTLKVGSLVGEPSTFLALRESAGLDVQSMIAAPPPYKYAFCGAAIANKVNVEVIREWLIYHLYVGEGSKTHFIFYDIGGLTEEGRKVLDPFVKAGFVTILDVSDQTRYPSWYHGQVLLINECLHRTRFLAEWTLFLDFDEFLYAEPPQTFSGVINEYANAPVLTFGSWPISISDCRPAQAGDEWPIERMLWRRPEPECRSKTESPWLCTAASGRRKYVVNSRKEFYASIHQTLGLTWNDAVHLNASVIRLEHFRGLLARETCRRTRAPGSQDSVFAQEWIEQPLGIVPIIKKAKHYAEQVLRL